MEQGAGGGRLCGRARRRTLVEVILLQHVLANLGGNRRAPVARTDESDLLRHLCVRLRVSETKKIQESASSLEF